MRVIKTYLILCIFLLVPTASWAISITNLDTKPHQVAISPMPGDRYVIEIPAGRTWQTFHPHLRIQLLDGRRRSEISTDTWEEYAIWPDGTFGIQKRRKSHGQGIF